MRDDWQKENQQRLEWNTNEETKFNFIFGLQSRRTVLIALKDEPKNKTMTKHKKIWFLNANKTKKSQEFILYIEEKEEKKYRIIWTVWNNDL